MGTHVQWYDTWPAVSTPQASGSFCPKGRSKQSSIGTTRGPCDPPVLSAPYYTIHKACNSCVHAAIEGREITTQSYVMKRSTHIHYHLLIKHAEEIAFKKYILGHFLWKKHFPTSILGFYFPAFHQVENSSTFQPPITSMHRTNTFWLCWSLWVSAP